MHAPASEPRSPATIFEAPRASSLRDEVLLGIERAIFLGSIAPGQRLVEADIARQMGVSKAPVREALRCLEQLGLIESHPRRGAFVTRLTAALASEAFSLRTLLETYAVRLIAPIIAEAQLRQLTALVNPDDATTLDHSAIVDHDLAFHDLLFALADHRLLHQAWTNLRQQIRLLLLVTGILHAGGEPGTTFTLASVHAPILAALARHDPNQAAAAVTAHLAMGERLLLQKLADGQGSPYVRPELFANGAAHDPAAMPGAPAQASAPRRE